MSNPLQEMFEKAKSDIAAAEQDIARIIALANPVELLTQLWAVFLTHPENEFPDVEEHAKWQVRIELIAWMLLTKPFSEPPEEVMVGNDILASLEEALDRFFRGWSLALLSQPTGNEPLDAEQTLKSRIQSEALHVRGEGNTDQVKALAMGIYGPHGAWMRQHLGFTIEEAFAYAEAIFNVSAEAYNGRLDESRQLRGQLEVEFSALLTEDRSGLSNREQEIYDAVQSTGAKEVANRYCFHACFSRLREAMGFTPETVAVSLGLNNVPESLAKFFERMSLRFGDVSTTPDPLGMNPLAERPLIFHDGIYYLPHGPMLYEALLSTFHFDLWRDDAYRPQYDDVRSKWLERQALETVRRLLPTAEVHWSLAYGPKKERQELDGLILYDNKLILIECKWKSLTLSARLGNVEAAHTDISKSIGASYQQAARARDFIREAKEPVTLTANDGRLITISPGQIKEVFLVSLLGRGALAMLAANLPRLAPPGLFGDQEYPWALSLIDLEMVCEVLEFPSQLFDYIKRRDAFVRDLRFLTHDEWDLLGLYLDGHLSTDDAMFKGLSAVQLQGFDTRLDQYRRAKENPLLPVTPKPRRGIPSGIADVIRAIDNSDQVGRSDFVVELLTFSDASLAQLAEALKAVVSRTAEDRKVHSASLFSEDRNAGIAIVTTHRSPQELSWRLEALCVGKKYQTKARVWLGIGVDAALPNPPHTIAFFEGPWTYDERREKLVEEITKSGRAITFESTNDSNG